MAPVAIVCVGMAGSGKTTFMQRINSYLHTLREPPYILNLDPAVKSTPFDSNIDIRDSINYREVMAQYNLGPNGGILTSLNLFATKVDQIMNILEKRCGVKPNPNSSQEQPSSSSSSSAPTAKAEATAAAASTDPAQFSRPIQNIIVDTPGQIEVFVWSASGQILLSSLASSFPTVIAYIIDTPRTASTSTFMSNMLYACSILYKTKLPMILVFNKTDVQPAEFAKEWMTDFEAFQAALRREEETGTFGGLEAGTAPSAANAVAAGGSGYMSSLLNSMSLVLEEFYKHLSVVNVSSMSGAGVDDFFAAVKDKAAEFERDYRPELERRRAERDKHAKAKRDKDMNRLMKDLHVAGPTAGAQASSSSTSRRTRRTKEEPETISDLEDADNGSEDDDDMEDEPEAVLVEPDDEDEAGDAADASLEARYKRALAEESNISRGGAAPSADDLSFLRYIRKANINS